MSNDIGVSLTISIYFILAARSNRRGAFPSWPSFSFISRRFIKNSQTFAYQDPNVDRKGVCAVTPRLKSSVGYRESFREL